MICPICNSDKFKKIFFMREVSRITKKGYPLFKCEKCSLIRPNPLPYTDTSKLSIYDSDDNIRFYDAGEKRILFNSKEYKDYFKHFRQFEDFVKKYSITGRHLDVGCGAGHLVFLLKKQGFKFYEKGFTSSNEKIIKGVISGIKDGSIDELLSAEKIIVNNEIKKGPDAKSVVVIETKTIDVPLKKRVKAHSYILKSSKSVYTLAKDIFDEG